ncbi:MAG: STAS domain-containing protein [Nitrospirales bacterium]
MIIVQSKQKGAVVLALSGRLDFTSRHDFQSAIQQAKETGSQLIVLNMKDVSFIDSAALGMLMVAFKDLQQSKIRLVIAEPQAYVEKIFTLANLGNIVSVCATVDEAVSLPISVVSR